jgi:N6-adenosine-specific RNA methylase IME4
MTRDPPLFAPLPRVAGGFACLHADPPIRFRSNSRENPGRNARRHYRCHDYADFEKLPVADVAADDAYLFLWVPGPFLAIGAHLPLVKAWGFKPSGVAFTWLKTYASGNLFMGPGLTTRKGTETVILAHRGKPKRLSTAVREVIVAPVREHSRKPDKVYARTKNSAPGRGSTSSHAKGAKAGPSTATRPRGSISKGRSSTQCGPKCGTSTAMP